MVKVFKVHELTALLPHSPLFSFSEFTMCLYISELFVAVEGWPDIWVAVG